MPINRDSSFVETMKPSMAVMFFDRVATNPNNEAFRYPCLLYTSDAADE